LHLEISKLATPGEINRLIQRGHAKQIIFGSDMPSRHIGAPLQMIELLEITPQQKHDIYAGNLQRILRIKPNSNTASATSHSPTNAHPRNFSNIIDTHIHLG